MAQWYHFYEHDKFMPQIHVGLYDRWLSQLGCGPTQAERAFVHTSMMEVAHERRFVVSETKQRMSHFEIEHSQQVEATISHLEAHFANNPSNELEDSSPHEHKALIGLAPMPLESRFIETFPSANRLLDTTMLTIEHVLESLSHIPVSKPSTADSQLGTSLTADDSENSGGALYEQGMETIREISQQTRRRLYKRPRQRRDVRIRKSILLPARTGPRRNLSPSMRGDGVTNLWSNRLPSAPARLADAGTTF